MSVSVFKSYSHLKKIYQKHQYRTVGYCHKIKINNKIIAFENQFILSPGGRLMFIIVFIVYTILRCLRF